MILYKIQTENKSGRSSSCSKSSFLVMLFSSYEIYICMWFYAFYAKFKLITRVVDQVHVPNLLFLLCFFLLWNLYLCVVFCLWYFARSELQQKCRSSSCSNFSFMVMLFSGYEIYICVCFFAYDSMQDPNWQEEW